MSSSSHRRLSRAFSFLDSLKRGRNHRRRKLSASLTPASESLESRTLLTSYAWLSPIIDAVPGSQIGRDGSEAVFESGTDVSIQWGAATDSLDYDIRIYHVDTGQEVVNENHLTSTEYFPAQLTAEGRYQVFIRHTDVGLQTGRWSTPEYFRLTGDVSENQNVTHFTGITNDPAPAINWAAAHHTGYVTTYEVVIYNVNAGQEVLRETDLTGTSLSLDFLNDSSDEFQAFIRTTTATYYGPTATGIYIPPVVSDWSAPFYFQGEGASQILPAAVLDYSDPGVDVASGILEWEPVEDAASYEVLIYDVKSGQAVTQVSRTDPSIGLKPYVLNGIQPPTFRHYQMFYRVHRDDTSTTLWSSPLDYFWVA